MASLKSMKIKLDAKGKEKSKSKTTKPKIKRYSKQVSELVEVEPDELPKVKTVERRKSIKDFLPKKEVNKKYMDFKSVISTLPFGMRVGYKLNVTFRDNKTGKMKPIYCNSGFYRGASTVKSYSRCENKVITEDVIKVSVGGKVYEIRENTLVEFYVFVDELNKQLYNGKAKKCYDDAVIARSKSLSHLDGGKTTQSNPLLKADKRSPKSANSLLKPELKSRTKPVERRANSLLH